jgi:membrane-associated PAP2 superfamily phosphatase
MNALHRRDVAVTLAAGALVLAWDLSGMDLALSRHFADGSGFHWRDAWLTRHLLHDGGRWLSAVVLAFLLGAALRRPTHGPARADRWRTLAVVLLGLGVVPLLKRASVTSCPWDLAEFGGSAVQVSHWLFGVADGGPGHCFPSGHAVAAFAFFALHFHWRSHRPARARAWLAGTLGAGALFGAAQVLRGAHFPSHVLWSGWICWTLAALADALFNRSRRPAVSRVAADGSPA